MSVVQVKSHLHFIQIKLFQRFPIIIKKNNSINVAKFYSYEMDFSCSKKKTKVSLFSSVWFTFS